MNRKERRRAESIGSAAPTAASGQQLLATAYQHHQAGRLPEAEQLYARVLAAAPDHVIALHMSGALAYQLGRHDAAVDFLRKAICLDGSNAERHVNLGLALRALGRLQEAVSSYSEAIRLQPTYFNAHFELGSTLAAQGKLDEAAAELRRTLSIRPSSAEAYNNLGSVLQKQGKWDEAIDAYQHALKLNPRHAEALVNLAGLWLAQGQLVDALGIAVHMLNVEDSERFRALFIQCLKYLSGDPAIGKVGPLVLRALTELWTRPSDLSSICIDVLKFDSVIGPCIARAASAWPGRLSTEQIFTGFSLAAFAEDPLARALLESTQVCQIDFERFLTAIRFNLIKNASAADNVEEPVLGFYCSLARQCFLNEYVFACTDTEMAQAEALRDKLVARLQQGQEVPALWIAAVAAYFPLHSLNGAEALLDMRWPDAVNDLLTQQIRDPLEEIAMRASIPVLTPIGDGVSADVKEQHEENPYPRWVKLAPAAQPSSLQAYLQARFSQDDFANLDKDSIDLLVAGSGTGQHPLEVARRYTNVDVLAIDRSLASLAYAQRQTRALGINNIRYAQADIMKLPSGGQTFDVIETVGVLHHLAEPFAGWRALLSQLRPGGVMLVGLYSESARTEIAAGQRFVAQRGHHATPDDIRRTRQELLEEPSMPNLPLLGDFYATGGCRDLFFNVHEHRTTIPQIKNFLAENDLTFLGFDVDFRIHGAYALRYPADKTFSNLDNWHEFEMENPAAFIGMYQCWVRKNH